MTEKQPDGGAERVSLAGPDPLDVLRAMLKVNPDAPPMESAQGDENRPDDVGDGHRAQQ